MAKKLSTQSPIDEHTESARVRGLHELIRLVRETARDAEQRSSLIDRVAAWHPADYTKRTRAPLVLTDNEEEWSEECNRLAWESQNRQDRLTGCRGREEIARAAAHTVQMSKG